MSQKRSSHPVPGPQPGQAPRLATRAMSASGPSTPVPAAWVSQRPVDPRKSLYNMCLSILSRLERIETMRPYIEACDYTELDEEMPRINLGVAPLGGKIDPVSQLWRVLRLGAPFGELFNTLKTPTVLEVLPPRQCGEVRTVKRLVYKFLEACMTELAFRPEHELFTISNVFSDSTSDLLKVLKTVTAILDLVDAKHGVAPPSASDYGLPAPTCQRDNVIHELVNTERKYVQDLELLSQYHDALLAANFPRESTQKMFPYLNRLVDFQCRFLVGLEYHARLPPEEQQFGTLFALMKDEFYVYEGYTLNQKEASEFALAEAPALAQFSDILEPTYELQAMLLKPVQRICKYPLLLKQIMKYTPHEWAPYTALLTGLEIMQDITQTVNETQRRIENRYVFSDLKDRLKDWRGLALERMGDLLLNGVFPVVTLDNEVEYHLYLFETILLCCRDGIPAKKTGPLKMRTRQSKRFSLDLKGRIYMSYVTGTRLVKEPSGYLLSVLWGKGDVSETGSFDIRLGNEEQAAIWDSTINKLITSINSGSIQTAYEEQEGQGANGPFYEDPQTPVSRAGSLDSQGMRKLSISSFGNSSSAVDMASRFSQSSRENGNGHRSSALAATLGGRAGRSMSTLSASTVVSPAAAMVHTNSESQVSTLQSPFGSSYAKNVSNGSFGAVMRHSSIASQASTSSLGLTPLRTHSDSISASASAGSTGPVLELPFEKHRVRVHHHGDSFLILVPRNITYEQLQARVEKKIRLCGKQVSLPLRVKYKDEDDDLVTLSLDEDLKMALEDKYDQELVLWVV